MVSCPFMCAVCRPPSRWVRALELVGERSLWPHTTYPDPYSRLLPMFIYVEWVDARGPNYPQTPSTGRTGRPSRSAWVHSRAPCVSFGCFSFPVRSVHSYGYRSGTFTCALATFGCLPVCPSGIRTTGRTGMNTPNEPQQWHRKDTDDSRTHVNDPEANAPAHTRVRSVVSRAVVQGVVLVLSVVPAN